jgi:hypothetical protein
MKKVLSLLCSALIMISCNKKQTGATETTHDFEKDKTTLYITTINTPEPGAEPITKLDQLPPVKKDEITSVTANHLEISLNELPDGSGFLARRKEPTSGIGYICDWCGALTTFKTKEGFLSFMSARGYKPVTPAENTTGKDYAFSKI